MALRFYNQLTKQVEVFSPIIVGSVGMYSCGPTVYDTPHIGNWRSLVFADTLKRFLESQGFTVRHVLNITDIDDKIIQKALVDKKSTEEIADKYEKEFVADWEKLDLLPPSEIPKATHHVGEMIKLTEKLLAKGMAYKSNGSVFFSVEKYPDYGELSGRQIDDNAQSRLEEDFAKKHPADFALWKAGKDGEPSFPSPFGPGRPGWHIECSAMSMCLLGETFDIHTGGIDLLFPHHENELAQSKAASGKPLANFWMEGEHLLVENEKMSKSLQNTYTLSDIAEKNISPQALKLLFLSAHYRSPLNFTWQAADAAEKSLARLRNKFSTLPEESGKVDAGYLAELSEFLGNDLSTPQAVALLFKLFDDENLDPTDKKATLEKFAETLGLKLETKKREIPKEIIEKAKEREKARQKEDWDIADRLRAEIESAGFVLKDTPNGPEIS